MGRALPEGAMSQVTTPRVVMVKKRLENGAPCRKCIQVEDMLRRRDLWETIDEVVIADETDPSSEGMRLAQLHGVEIAPFFVVYEGQGERVYESAIKVSKEVLNNKKAAQSQKTAAPSFVQANAMMQSEAEYAQKQLVDAPPQEILKWALERQGERCAIAFSGAEDVVLIDMAVKSGLPFSVFCLDTGRLHPQTYRFIDTTRQFYGIDLRVIAPEGSAVEALVRKKGLFSFYEDGHGECCGIRKIAPLRKVLADYDGWITGQRRDQSPTRADVPVVDWDRAHRASGMLKVNPLVSLTQNDIWSYIRDQGVPYNELHDQGFASIGCEPCTRALRPGEHERAARWWWEDATKRECGLHVHDES